MDCVIPLCPNELPTAETLAQSFCTVLQCHINLFFQLIFDNYQHFGNRYLFQCIKYC